MKNKVVIICSPQFCAINLTVAQGVAVSKELSLHPVHLTPDNKGELPPSALVPFCSYQRNSNLLGQKRPELNNLTICDKFEQTILEGQLCYSLDIVKVLKKSSSAGKHNGLWILLDPSPFRLNFSGESTLDDQTRNFKIYVHTLSQYTAHGPGARAMSVLKSMTGTESFKQLPDSQKKCQVHNREECETKMFLKQVRSNCNCVPWALLADGNSEGVGMFVFLIGDRGTL